MGVEGSDSFGRVLRGELMVDGEKVGFGGEGRGALEAIEVETSSDFF